MKAKNIFEQLSVAKLLAALTLLFPVNDVPRHLSHSAASPHPSRISYCCRANLVFQGDVLLAIVEA